MGVWVINRPSSVRRKEPGVSTEPAESGALGTTHPLRGQRPGRRGSSQYPCLPSELDLGLTAGV